MSLPEQDQRLPRWLTLGAKVVISMAAVVFGLVTIVYITAVVHYFGPYQARPLLDDEVFRFSALGAFLAVSVPTYLFWRRRYRLLVALACGVAAAIAIGLLARDIAHG